MGNCQAIDNATLVIQYPCGRAEKLYWPITASEVMKMNPGHYVALLITTTTTTLCPSTTKAAPETTTAAAANNNNNNNNSPVRITRIKLLRATDTLILGHVYRLITTHEVMKGLLAKKQAKLRKKESEPADSDSDSRTAARRSELDKSDQVVKHERSRRRTAASAASRSRAWQPSLNSISEATT